MSMAKDFFLSVRIVAMTMGIPPQLPLLILAILIFCEAASVVSASCLDLRYNRK